ncbi:Hansenula MRAKII killer toxin-resistant protein 1 [Winogradskya humida]|nr:Hansenula MRAKII killer toxin-resistant protein 1 [Actinoplanes humidus]
MAAKGWITQVAAAAGVAAGTGAAQLGLGYGLGVVVWPATATPDDSVWLGSLGWATWIAASATVFGAVIAGRLGQVSGGLWRFALAASASVGALLTVALVALPARAAVHPDEYTPQSTAGGYALIGVLLGMALAYWAVFTRPVAANLIATATWLWALAIAAVVMDVFWHQPSATYLTSWQFTGTDPGAVVGTIYWPSALLTLLAAFVLGILGAWAATRRGDFGLGTASSGAVGPLLVATAFFVLAPQLTGSLGPLESAYLTAPYAVLAGLAGSALTVSVGRRAAERRTARANRPPQPPRQRRTRRSKGTESPAVVTGRAKAPESPAERPAWAGGPVTPRPRTSTVTPPPDSPTVAQINPPSSAKAGSAPLPSGAGSAASSASGGSATPAQKAAGRGQTDPVEADKAPARKTVSAKKAAPGQTSMSVPDTAATTTTPRQARPATAPSKSASTPAKKANPAAPGAQPKPAVPGQPAKATPARKSAPRKAKPSDVPPENPATDGTSDNP